MYRASLLCFPPNQALKLSQCDGNSPCTRCTLREIECVSSLSSDKISLQHAHANLEVQRRREEDYKSVFTVLQSGSDGDAAEILAHLRLGKDVGTIATRLREASRDETTTSCSPDNRDMQPPSPNTCKPMPTPTWSLRTLDQTFLVPLFDRRIWDVEEGEGDIDIIKRDTEIWQEPLPKVSQNYNHKVQTLPVSDY